MLMMPPPAVRTRFADWPLAVKSILGFWLFYALTVVARAFLGADPWTTLENKLVVIGIGIVITGLIYLAIAAFGGRRNIRRKAIIAGVASVVASIAMGGTLILHRRPDAREQGGIPLPGARGLHRHREGPHDPHRAHARRSRWC